MKTYIEDFDPLQVLDKWIRVKQLRHTIEVAVANIVTYNTLPSQIDYTAPWRHKAEEAQELIDRLPTGIRRKYYDQIEAQIEQHHAPMEDFDQMSAADLNELF